MINSIIEWIVGRLIAPWWARREAQQMQASIPPALDPNAPGNEGRLLGVDIGRGDYAGYAVRGGKKGDVITVLMRGTVELADGSLMNVQDAAKVAEQQQHERFMADKDYAYMYNLWTRHKRNKKAHASVKYFWEKIRDQMIAEGK